MKSDIEIAHSISLQPIEKVAEKVGIPTQELHNYGKYIAKIPHNLIDEQKVAKSNLILVTAITPTKTGIGKTTVSIGLSLGMNKLNKKTIVALREPSLGPCFGMKGGAAGGGYSQVLPMENINLHFTGDFHAITSSHNMITALLDNYVYRNRGTEKALKDVIWKRVLDVNDRNLRYVVTGLRGTENGIPGESGFEITPASEIMAILCLAKDIDDLKTRIEKIILGFTMSGEPFTVKDLGVAGAITVLLKDAVNPNVVQSTEHSAALIHGGPFANIAHGCNSIIATKTAMTYADYVITEAGFGADLGAEKFYNIKCRAAGISPKVTILVATIQGLKMHGDVPLDAIKTENKEGVQKGLLNLAKHVDNIRSFGQNVIVTLNKFGTDTQAETDIVKEYCEANNIKFAINEGFAKGGEGCLDLAKAVIECIEQQPSPALAYTYDEKDSIVEKVEKVARKIYGAKSVNFSSAAKKKLQMVTKLGIEHYPICIAKTQYSFSDNAQAYGVPAPFDFTINDIAINNGAGFVVVIAGSIMRMPGLPKIPQANHIDLIDGEIIGLS